ESVSQGRTNVLEGKARQSLVQNLCYALHAVRRDRSRYLNEDRPYRAASQIEYEQQPVGRHLGEINPLEDDLIERRTHRDSKLLSQHTEYLGRPAQDFLDGGAGRRHLQLDEISLFPAGRREPHQVVHVPAVCLISGNPAGRRVRMVEISLLLQLAHRVANGRRGDSQPAPLHNSLTGRGLGGLDEGLDDRFKHPGLAVIQRVMRRHGNNLTCFQAISATNASSRSQPSGVSRRRPLSRSIQPASIQPFACPGGTAGSGNPSVVRRPRYNSSRRRADSVNSSRPAITDSPRSRAES